MRNINFMKTPRPESERAAAARLKEALKLNITRASIRRLIAKGVDLQDADAVRHAYSMQERKPSSIGSATNPPQPKSQPKPTDRPPKKPESPKSTSEYEPGNITSEITRIETELAACVDYETARTLRMKLTGLKDAFRLHKERGEFVTIESQLKSGAEMGQVVRALILKIPTDLPQMILGLDYADAVLKCEDYAFGMLTEIMASADSSYFNGKKTDTQIS